MSGNQPKKISVRTAIAIGLVRVNLPILPIMLGLPILLLWMIEEVSGLLILFYYVLSFVLAWTWWAIMVPQWRLWAYLRVEEIFELKRYAVMVGLTWPDGHFFERTEIKSKEHAARERQLEGIRR